MTRPWLHQCQQAQDNNSNTGPIDEAALYSQYSIWCLNNKASLHVREDNSDVLNAINWRVNIHTQTGIVTDSRTTERNFRQDRNGSIVSNDKNNNILLLIIFVFSTFLGIVAIFYFNEKRFIGNFHIIRNITLDYGLDYVKKFYASLEAVFSCQRT